MTVAFRVGHSKAERSDNRSLWSAPSTHFGMSVLSAPPANQRLPSSATMAALDVTSMLVVSASEPTSIAPCCVATKTVSSAVASAVCTLPSGPFKVSRSTIVPSSI